MRPQRSPHYLKKKKHTHTQLEELPSLSELISHCSCDLIAWKVWLVSNEAGGTRKAPTILRELSTKLDCLADSRAACLDTLSVRHTSSPPPHTPPTWV